MKKPAILAMLAIVILVDVWVTESTPIVAAMRVAGMSPGAVLVFLLAGPAINLGIVGALCKRSAGVSLRSSWPASPFAQ